MSPNATTSDIVAAVRRARTCDDPSEVAFQLVHVATHMLDEDDHIGRVYLARLMLRVARSLDEDVTLSTQ
jgi:hypothetical protein